MPTNLQFELEETTIDAVQQAMANGELSALELVQLYLERIDAIDANGPALNTIIELNPDAELIASELDRERAVGKVHGPLHGVPILIKDNLDTDDQMSTTAGSLALLGSRPTQDATVVARLRNAGAVILGKTNLSEWSSFRSSRAAGGWSGRGGQTHNPYEFTANPCGSSSGSAAAVAANLAMVAIGTETDGSIVCPAHANGIVGIKPTVGLTSRAGVIPISHTQDTVGPFARTVRDAAIVLSVMAGFDDRDPATVAGAKYAHNDYTQFLNPHGLRGARIGVPRHKYRGNSEEADALLAEAVSVLKREGATIIDPTDIPSIDDVLELVDDFKLLQYEFKADLNAYLAQRIRDDRHLDVPFVRTLGEVIEYNRAHPDQELPYFGQELMEYSNERGPLTDPEYLELLDRGLRLSRDEGIDAVLDRFELDALVAPTGRPAWQTSYDQGDEFACGTYAISSVAGYPIISVPMGFAGNLPVGMNIIGRAWSEPTLIRLAYAFEQATLHRRPPRL